MSDIVERLNAGANVFLFTPEMGPTGMGLLREAAAEIARLRADYAKWEKRADGYAEELNDANDRIADLERKLGVACKEVMAWRLFDEAECGNCSGDDMIDAHITLDLARIATDAAGILKGGE